MQEKSIHSKPLNVCYFGTYRAGYSRNRIMIDGLRANDVTVIECHEPLWRSIEDRVHSVSGGWRKPSFWWRVARTYARLLTKFRQNKQDFDLLIVGYPGQFDLFLARLLAWWSGKPLVWDVFMSIYLISLERELEQFNPRVIRWMRRMEWLACRLPDQLVLDTADYAAWFEETHGIPTSAFCLVPTGADDKVFTPLEPSRKTIQVAQQSISQTYLRGESLDETKGTSELAFGEPPGIGATGEMHAGEMHAGEMHADGSGEAFTVLYYGSYIPNHGVLTIIDAARYIQSRSVGTPPASGSMLSVRPIRFVLVGDGPQRAAAEKRADEYELHNVEFVQWLTQAELRTEIRRAGLCLGSFGTTPQSLMTVQNKIYECMAMARPVLTGDSPAVRRALTHETHVYLCPRHDAMALADAIERLSSDERLCEQLSAAGYQRFVELYTVEAIGKRYKACLEETRGKLK